MTFHSFRGIIFSGIPGIPHFQTDLPIGQAVLVDGQKPMHPKNTDVGYPPEVTPIRRLKTAEGQTFLEAEVTFVPAANDGCIGYNML